MHQERYPSFLAAALLVLLLAAGLRFHLLDNQSFWNDEGNTARLSERTPAKIIEGTASDIHPPLYYLLLRGWREGAGDGEFGLRAFSVFSGVLTVAGTVTLARLLRRRRERLPALAAGVVVAISPALVYYSQEARMYSLLAMWAVLSTVFFVKWSDGRAAVRSLPLIGSGWGAAYLFSAAAGLYTHYFFPAVLAAHQLCFAVQLLGSLFAGERKPAWMRIRQWALLNGGALLLYLPWLPIFLDQFGSEPPPREGVWQFAAALLRWLAAGRTLPEGIYPWLAGVLALLLGVGVWYGRRQALLPLLGLMLPPALMVFTGTMDAAYWKFMVLGVPFAAVLAGMGLNAVGLRRTLPAVLLLLFSAAAVTSLNHMYHDPAFARADYRSMAARIVTEDHPNAGVIVNAPNQWEVFTYYFPEAERVYPLPRGRSRPVPAELELVLAEITARHDRIYAIFWGEAQRDPERLVERWLDAHAFKAVDEWVGDVRFVMYASPPALPEEMETTVNIRFEEGITLEGYTLPRSELQPGDVIQVALFWQTAVPLSNRYKIFLHLLDEQGNLVAQRDSEPGGGLALTTGWPVAETIRDNHGVYLPLHLSSGKYTLAVGLYDFHNAQQRLMIPAAATDSYSLADIFIDPGGN